MNEDASGSRPPGPRQRPAGRRRSGWLAAALVPAAVGGTFLLAAGCGSTAATPRASHGLPTVQMLDSNATCMRSHGVPDFYWSRSSTSAASTAGNLLKLGPWTAPADPGSARFQAAMKACQHLLPRPQLSAAQQQSMERRLLSQAACLRAHGYPGYPDPSVHADGIMQPPLPSSIDTGSPQFGKAQQTCSGG